MPRFIALPIRHALFNAHLGGVGTAELAARFKLSPRTVRHIVEQGRQDNGIFQPAQYRRGTDASAFTPTLRQQVIALRQEHPRWGATMLRLWLEKQRPTDSPPSDSTIRRWLQEVGFNPSPAGRKASTRPRSCTAHEVWQMDAADQIPLRSGQLVSWLRLVDECTGAVLQTIVFPLVFNCVAPGLVQEALREVFIRWGMPTYLRMDNGLPWGTWNDLPTAMELWLSGLGLSLIYNRPRHPQENGVVERSHGIAKAWAEPETAESVCVLQQRLDEIDQIQRERYPRVCGLSRWQVYPELQEGGRSYSREWEQKNWSLEVARDYLSEHVAKRIVSGQGQVRIYNHRYCVGRLHKSKQTLVQYDDARNEWLFGDEQGQEWCRRSAEQITLQRIMALSISDQ